MRAVNKNNRIGKRYNYMVSDKVDFATFFKMLRYLWKYRFRLVAISIVFIISMVIQTYTGLYIKILVDNHIMRMLKEMSTLSHINYEPFYESIISYGILLLVGVACNFLYSIVMVYIGQNVMRDIREEMFESMEKLPISYFDKNETGNIMSHFTADLDTMRQSLTNAIPQSFAAIFTVLILFVSMMMLSINLTLIAVVVILIMFLITKKLGKVSLSANIKAQESIADLDAYVEEMVKGAKEVKLFCYEDRNIKRFDKKNLYWRDNTKLADMMAIVIMPLNNGFGNIMYILIALIGGFMAINNMTNFYFFGTGYFTLGTIVSFLTFTKNITREVGNVSSQVPYIVQSLSGAKRVFDLFEEKKEEDSGEVYEKDGYWIYDKEKIKINACIKLEDVSFSYDGVKKILKDINISAMPGQKIAIVGKTGAGKTTITNLINRFYNIDSGVITYDGININNIKKSALRKNIALVLQDVHLFSGTIMENIRYGNINATDEDCINAAKETCANSFIEQLENGYDTIISEDSGDLSQGQKQLLAIARAYVADPPFLILDEATSNIDARTEKLVQDGMDKIMRDRTVFVIAHRLSTIKNSNMILVVDDGKIIERGNHNELMKLKSVYYKLYTGAIEMD